MPPDAQVGPGRHEGSAHVPNRAWSPGASGVVWDSEWRQQTISPGGSFSSAKACHQYAGVRGYSRSLDVWWGIIR